MRPNYKFFKLYKLDLTNKFNLMNNKKNITTLHIFLYIDFSKYFNILKTNRHQMKFIKNMLINI